VDGFLSAKAEEGRMSVTMFFLFFGPIRIPPVSRLLVWLKHSTRMAPTASTLKIRFSMLRSLGRRGYSVAPEKVKRIF
jgi:hypothetical protein